MNDCSIIRRLIVAQWVFWLLSAFVKELHIRSIPESLRRQVDFDLFAWGNPAITWPLLLIATTTVLFSYVALWRMRPGSGRLFLWVNGIAMLPGFFMPPAYGSGIAFSLEFLGTTCFGMTVAWILLGRVPEIGGSVVAPSASPQPA